jgi:hypothetical protein
MADRIKKTALLKDTVEFIMYVGIFNGTFSKLLICYTKYIMQCNLPKAGIIFIETTNIVYVLNVLEMICSMSLFR